MGKKIRGVGRHMHTQKKYWYLREKKKKQTYWREEAGMSFTLPLHINLSAKKLAPFYTQLVYRM